MSEVDRNLFGEPVGPSYEPPANKHEFIERFVVHMLERAGQIFDDGASVEEYARETAPSYWDEADYRLEGPEECAEADMSYWGED